jgi:hypothetical protein
MGFYFSGKSLGYTAISEGKEESSLRPRNPHGRRIYRYCTVEFNGMAVDSDSRLPVSVFLVRYCTVVKSRHTSLLWTRVTQRCKMNWLSSLFIHRAHHTILYVVHIGKLLNKTEFWSTNGTCVTLQRAGKVLSAEILTSSSLPVG